MKVWIVIAHLFIPGYSEISAIPPTEQYGFAYRSKATCEANMALLEIKREVKAACEQITIMPESK